MASLVDNVLKTLETFEWWRTLRALPDRMAALEARMAEIDAGRAPGACPKCGKGPMRVTDVTADEYEYTSAGMVLRHMACDGCCLTFSLPYRPSPSAPRRSPAR